MPTESLYFSFDLSLLDEDGNVKSEALAVPDFSCNWDRFSEPEDVRYRKNGKATDACAALYVSDVHYDNFAVPVHDPICNELPENYSHVEVRQVPANPDGKPNEINSIESEPPRGYKGGKARRNEWRRNVRNKVRIILKATA